jgi:FSR family fosmidomycin resistance protein-like MFS transporter
MFKRLSRMVFLVALAHLTIELCANFLPVLYPTLIKTMGLTYAQVGVVALVLGLSEAFTQPGFGYISDRWGAQRLMVLSIAWIGLAMGLIGFTNSYLGLLGLVVLGGLGSAAFHPAGATLTSRRAGSRRGTAQSVFAVGGNLGSATSPLLVALTISWLGLTGTTVIIPIALLVSLLLYWQLQQENASGISSGAHSSLSLTHSDLRSGSKLGLALIVGVVMCRSWTQVALMTYLPEWVQGQGGSLAAGGQMLALFMIAASLGSLAGGSLSDRVGRWQVLALSMALLSPAIWLLFNLTGLGQMAMMGVIGVLIGLSFPVAVVMAQETWPHGIGLASALVMGLGWAPGGLGAWFTGMVADTYSLEFGLGLLIVPPLLGLACMLAYVALQRRAAHRIKLDMV